MKKPVFAVLLFSVAILIVLIVWHVYANILGPSYVSMLLGRPTIITGQTSISESGYYILNDDISCSNITGEAACISFDGGSGNFILDCRGHSITGPGRRYPTGGIEVHSTIGGTVKNCVVKDFNLVGILLHHSVYNTILNNTVTNSNLGIYNDGCSYNKIINNTVINNHYGIYLFLPSSHYVSIINNTANNNEIAGIYLFNSPSNNTLTGNTVNNNSKYGIWFNPASGTTLNGNMICGNSEVDVLCTNSSVIDEGNNVCLPELINCGSTNINCINSCP
jgi:parallel beta-helix repeat protein